MNVIDVLDTVIKAAVVLTALLLAYEFIQAVRAEYHWAKELDR